jgi:mRNA interferase HigB
MRITSPKMLRVFAARHPDAASPLNAWRQITKHAEWQSFDDVRAVFGKRVDRYKQYVIFDIGGNKFRLIAAIHYNRGRLYIRHVLTHAEYSAEKWKDG